MNNKIIRLRKVSWKSKNNIYGILLNDKKFNIDFDEILNELGTIDVLILPLTFKKQILPYFKFFNVNNIYYVSINKLDSDSNFISVSDSKEVVDYISIIDNVNISVESGACAKFAIDLGSKYYWKNFLIFLF